MKKYILLVLLAACFSVSAIAQEFVGWKYGAKKVSDNEAELIFTASIDARYHMYSMDKVEEGPMPLEFTFEPSADYELIGSVTSNAPIKTEYDESFEKDLDYYSGSAVFVQRIKVLTTSAFKLSGALSYQICGEGTCIPGDADYSFDISGDLPPAQAGGMEPTAENIKSQTSEPTRTSNTDQAQKVGPEETIAPMEDSDESLLSIILMALGLGLAAVFTPCVFPMVPMTVAFFMSGESGRFSSIMKAVVFALSVAAVYTLLGVVVAIFKTPAIAEVISTHWIPNLIFAAMFLIFSASFFGMFEITLPSGLANKADSKADRGGYIGSFFMAVVLAIVSFSCTGPFVGSLLIEAAQGVSALKPIVGMFVFGLAMSLPFVILAMFPALLKKMPKSGGWLNAVKVVFAFIMVALCVKFISMAGIGLGVDLISRTVAIALWIALAILLGVYLLGKLKFSHDSDVKYVSVPRFAFALASFTFAIYLVPGLFGADLNAVSAFLPAKDDSTFDLSEQVAIAGSPSAAAYAEAPCGVIPKYSDTKMHTPEGIKGYFDLYEAIACAKEQNKPLLLDFKGYSCANCKKMEATTFKDQRVIGLINKEFIMVCLYNDEDAPLPENERYVAANGKKIETLGKRNNDYQMTKFANIGRPYFAVMDADENVIEKGLGYASADELIDFLNKALATYKK
ncbi:MAG: DUF255 domain-containing protein [Prevotellaceae bacterium]|jgi:thiol:disulfide interchange protein DsbD|nr:DUF255 domain-containing protein [Prevotellaceae bacterium]